jgi:hypothetical protein
MSNQPENLIPLLFISLSPPNGVTRKVLYESTNRLLWRLTHFTDTHLYQVLRAGKETGNKHEHLVPHAKPDELKRFWKRFPDFIPETAWEHKVIKHAGRTNLKVDVYDPERAEGNTFYIQAHPDSPPEQYAIKVFCPRYYGRCDEEYCRHDKANPRPQPASNRRNRRKKK